MPQIVANFKNKSTGQLSKTTFGLNWFGACARLGTILMETDSLGFKLQSGSGVVVNSILMSQFFLYPEAKS